MAINTVVMSTDSYTTRRDSPFSHAVSSKMPLMSTLGESIATRFTSSELSRLLNESERSSVARGRVPFDNLEVWLSSVSVDQPFLTEAQNLQRRSLFLELADQIVDEIEIRRDATCQDPMPAWLKRLVALWHHSRAEVITLNYDILIETAVESLRVSMAQAHHLARSTPPVIPRSGTWADEIRPTFALRKLHGSTNWFGRASNSDMFSVVRVDQLVPIWGSDVRPLPEDVGARVYGMAPMILPPISDKSSLYGNATMSAVWKAARAALVAAKRLVIIGYSIPQTDASVLSLLDDALASDVEIAVVDVNSKSVAANLASLARSPCHEVEPPGSTAFDQFLRDLEFEVNANVDWSAANHLHERTYAEVLLPGRVRWPIARLDSSNDSEVRLIAGPEPNEHGVGIVRPSPNPIDVRGLGSKIRIVEFPDGRTAVPLNIERVESTNEESTLHLDVSEPVSSSM